MGVFSKSVRLRICRIWHRVASNPNRLPTIATSTYTDTAIQICVFHRVLAGAVKGFDPQVLLDAFEQLNDILPINNDLLKSRSTTDSIPCVHTACR